MAAPKLLHVTLRVGINDEREGGTAGPEHGRQLRRILEHGCEVCTGREAVDEDAVAGDKAVKFAFPKKNLVADCRRHRRELYAHVLPLVWRASSG